MPIMDTRIKRQEMKNICGDQQINTPHIIACGLVQTSNAKARPHSPYSEAEGALPRSSAISKPCLAGYRGERLRRRFNVWNDTHTP